MDSIKEGRLLSTGITFRDAELSDMENIDAFLKQEVPGWPRGQCYFKSLLESCPGCFKVAQAAKGDLCGLALGLSFNDDVGLLDYLVVRRDLRGQGIGRTLIKDRLEFLGNRNILLTTTSAVSGIYIRRGFKFFNLNCEQQLWSGRIPENWVATVKEPTDGLNIEDMDDTCVSELTDYNYKIQGIRNDWIFKHLIRLKQHAIGKVAFIKKQIVGFAYVLVSPSANPRLTIYADSLTIGKTLLSSLYKSPNSRRSEKWDLLIPDANEDALRLVQEFGLADDNKGDCITLMYSKNPIPIMWDRIYAGHTNGCNV